MTGLLSNASRDAFNKEREPSIGSYQPPQGFRHCGAYQKDVAPRLGDGGDRDSTLQLPGLLQHRPSSNSMNMGGSQSSDASFDYQRHHNVFPDARESYSASPAIRSPFPPPFTPLLRSLTPQLEGEHLTPLSSTLLPSTPLPSTGLSGMGLPQRAFPSSSTSLPNLDQISTVGRQSQSTDALGSSPPFFQLQGNSSSNEQSHLSFDYEPLSRQDTGVDEDAGRGKDTSMTLTTQDRDSLCHFVDKLGLKHDLSHDQVSSLKRHVEYNSDGNVGSVKSFIVIHGALCQVLNKLDAQHVDQEGITELVANVNREAKGNISVPAGVRKMIQELSKDKAISPDITDYTTLPHQLYDIVKDDAKNYECEELLSKPMGNKAIRQACKDAAKSALQQFRMAIISLIWGETTGKKKGKDPLMLEEFTYMVMDKWRPGGVGSSHGKNYQMRFAMIRVWVLCLGKERAMASGDVDDMSGNPNEDNDGNENGVSSSSDRERPAKRQKSGGRTAQKRAFWSMITEELQKKVNTWGTDLRKEEWKRYLASCVHQDWEKFGKSQRLLEALNFESVRAPSTSRATPNFARAEEELGDDDP
ncbi:hypothetical protein EV361DRAFT_940952 [Lentinula raphanica]|nr:hypothetical protein EV361DRAFT_940952 [Lentinula raphanica]